MIIQSHTQIFLIYTISLLFWTNKITGRFIFDENLLTLLHSNIFNFGNFLNANALLFA